MGDKGPDLSPFKPLFCFYNLVDTMFIITIEIKVKFAITVSITQFEVFF